MPSRVIGLFKRFPADCGRRDALSGPIPVGRPEHDLKSKVLLRRWKLMRCNNPLGDGGVCRREDVGCCVLQQLFFTHRPSLPHPGDA